ncbi:MAG: hypothetical protein IJP89_06305 [Synergistaceae bacterium]|nr:hypothetical protein [Synergistaceae bacterium]MBR0150955.1 hypothetical protein [Synergistaceae bacterium]MBR0256613.1 hypothetical protein [Synergistaceae bacterium]
MDYSRNATYFTDLPKGGCSGCLGILLGLGGIGGLLNGDIVAGIGCIVVAGILVAMSSSAQNKDTRISGGEYDAAIAKYVDGLSRTRVLEKLGVNASEVREIAPIILGGYEFAGADKVKQGTDQRWRSNVYKVVMLFFSRNELYCYTLRFMTTEDYILNEATDVYFYQDVVSVSTASVNETVEVGENEITINTEAFTLTTKGGTSITVNLLNSQYAQKSINAMRALLREKKQA